jgi:hypothetical protein
MDGHTYLINDRIWNASDPQLQHALARVYDSPERPRCMCVPGGVEMYVAKHGHYLVKRMPDTGSRHNPACNSFELELGQSGLGELMGEAVIERAPDALEVRLDFPLARAPGKAIKAIPRGEPKEPSAIKAPRHRLMSLHALLCLLWERAGFNRWYPAMAGKRSQAVIRKYVTEAADEIETKGIRLAERLYVPEPFQEDIREAIQERRRSKLAMLHSPEDDGQFKMGLVLGQFKAVEAATTTGQKIWLKHMPDCPLLIDEKTWSRAPRASDKLFESQDADTTTKPRLMVLALVYAKREYTYQVDAVTFMLVTDSWIPIEGTHEGELLQALTEQQRRFIKPLRYDAKSAAHFPNVLLLDTGDRPTPLHVVGGDDKEKAAKEKALKGSDPALWVWYTDKPMPPLPVQGRYRTSAADTSRQYDGGAATVDVPQQS